MYAIVLFRKMLCVQRSLKSPTQRLRHGFRKSGAAEAEAILRRFTRGNLQHPTYQALAELGKVLKTIFLCRYIDSEALRREIHEGLNVVENWNSANEFIFYGKSGEVASNRLEE